ncbi:MAG: hypothetical protein QM675_05165 [Protaetiibacter sp.]
MTAWSSFLGLPAVEIGSRPLASVRLRSLTTILLLAAAGVTAIVATVGVATTTASAASLLAGPGFGIVIAELVAIAAFVVAVHGGSFRLATSALVVVVVVMRLPAVAAVADPVYTWTYKHLGVVDYIATTGHATPTDVDIYSGWPGFFAAFAWLHSATGISTTQLAQWFPLAIDLACAAAVYALARAATLAPLPALTASMISVLVNWVAQDYFSPQAISYVLALVVLALLLHGRRRPLYGWLSVPAFLGIVVTHQLTPFWLIVSALALGVLGRIRPRWIGVVYGLIAGVYLLLERASLGHEAIVNTSSPLETATDTATTFASGSIDQLAATLAARGVAVSVYLLCAIVLVLAWRRGGRGWTVASVGGVLTFAPLLLLTVQSYGGEGILRAYLYGVPGAALLLAPVAYASVRAGSRIARVVTAGLAVAILIGSLQALYGNWRIQLVTPGAIAVTQYALETIPDDAYLLSPGAGGPNRAVGDYVRHAVVDSGFDIPMSAWAGWPGSDFTGTQWLTQLERGMGGSGRPVYIIVTDGMAAQSDYLGTYPAGSIDRFQQALLDDPDWRVVFSVGGNRLFELVPSE